MQLKTTYVEWNATFEGIDISLEILTEQHQNKSKENYKSVLVN